MAGRKERRRRKPDVPEHVAAVKYKVKESIPTQNEWFLFMNHCP